MKTPKEILEHFKIPFSERSQSVTHLCYGVNCPFCNDNNFHCGIFKEYGNFSCWKCGKKGSLFQLVKQIIGCSYSEFKQILGKSFMKEGSIMSNLDRIFNKEEEVKDELKLDINGDCKFSPIKSDNMLLSVSLLIEAFLVHRNFSYETLESFCALYCHSGFLSQRLVIPLHEPDDFQIYRGYIGRDLTGLAIRKYLLHPFGMKLDNYLYFTNVLASNEPVILVEGVFDAWAVDEIGFVGAAMLGSNLSKGQIQLLKERTSQIIYIPDGDTPAAKHIETKNRLRNADFKVNSILISNGKDPCSMNRKELGMKIRESLNHLNV